MAKTGQSKSPKRDQPKRKRYNTEKRGVLNKIRKLTRHLKRYTGDVQAIEALKKLKMEKG